MSPHEDAARLAGVPGRSPAAVERAVRSGDDLVLVCAYPNDTGLEKYPLPGAISRTALADRTGDLERDAAIVFYCACPEDRTARRVAATWRDEGWSGASVLVGGWAAWRDAGLAMPRGTRRR